VASESYVELVELAASFVHEIKNHVSTLGLNLQLLAEDFQEPQSQRERRALERIQRLQNECAQLVDLSNDVLRFARVKDLELATASLAAVIDEMVNFFGPTARQANIEIKSYLPADLPLVALDREMFKQALLNLMLNAHQAMPSGGQLTIQATMECDGERPGQVCINFIDTGQGISQELLGRVFRPFFSTRPEGTGLGLATTRKIVEAHGGTIDVQSELDRGTKFTIRLPACSEKPSPPIRDRSSSSSD
jgi:two-component system, NtrC family, sensor histidine kinase HydH